MGARVYAGKPVNRKMKMKLKNGRWHLPHGPVVKTALPMQEPGFDPWSGN